MKTSLRIVTAIALVFTISAIAGFSFVLTRDGKTFGTAKINVQERGAGYLVSTESSLSSPQKINIKETFTLESDWLPTDYSLYITSSDLDKRTSIAFSESGAKIKSKAGMGSVENIVESAKPLTPWLEDISFAGLIVLLNRAGFKDIGSRAEFTVLDPIKSTISSVTMDAVEKEKDFLTISGKHENGWSFTALWNPKKAVLSKLTVQGEFEASLEQDEGVEETSKTPQGFHPLSKNNINDQDLMKRVTGIYNLQSGLALNIESSYIERLYLNHFSQEFAGEVSESSIMGSIEVKNIGHKVTNTPDWPLYYPLVGYDEKYIMPERDVDSDDPAITEKALKIVAPAVTLWDAARAINLWVNRNIEYTSDYAGAAVTFKALKGDSRSKALLCVALCRAVGIPARVVSGVLWADGPIDHSWVEVYLGEKTGWGPMDPTLNEADKINAGHISLWLGSQVPPVYAKEVLLENTIFENK